MQFLAIIATLFAALPVTVLGAPSQDSATVRAVNNTWDESWILAGPASYADVQSTVAGMKATGSHPNSVSRRNGGGTEGGGGGLDKRVCEGVYLCDGADFSGSCYYGCYPISTGIKPDSYWVGRLVSAGPDQGGWCDFYGGDDCDPGKFSHIIFGYPGGNLPDGIAHNLGCFYCNPS